MAFLLDEDGFESSLEDMTRPLVVAIDPLRVDPVEVSGNSARLSCLRVAASRNSLSDEPSIGKDGHQAVRMADPSLAIYHFVKDTEESTTIGAGEEDLLASIATARDVVDVVG